MSLCIRPISLRDANAFVAAHHRHHRPTQGGKFAVACHDGDRLCGVAVVGRPVSRRLDDGRTAEVTRVATDGTPNACSKLYAAAKRTCQAMGYVRVVTYTLESESGASLFGAGWTDEGPAGGGSWGRDSRPRDDKAPTERKRRWCA